jgi:hypothetical protein
LTASFAVVHNSFDLLLAISQMASALSDDPHIQTSGQHESGLLL